MRANLIDPADAVRPLAWTTDHPASHYGLGVLLLPDDGAVLAGETLDGATFRAWRDAFGLTIQSDDPDAVCRSLGVPPGEPGITI